MNTFTDLSTKCQDLVKKLNWQSYHTPENLTSILIGEVGELSELCVWLTKKQIIETKAINNHITKELADVVKATIFLYNSLHIDVNMETLIVAKLNHEDIKYPVADYKGLSKYEKLSVEQRKKIKALNLPTKNNKLIPTIEQLKKRAWENTIKREWDKYYTPASLCLGIFEDCSKIYTSFQRRTNLIESPYKKLVWAIAGILILSLRLHVFLELDDYNQIILKKIKEDLVRFR